MTDAERVLNIIKFPNPKYMATRYFINELGLPVKYPKELTSRHKEIIQTGNIFSYSEAQEASGIVSRLYRSNLRGILEE